MQRHLHLHTLVRSHSRYAKVPSWGRYLLLLTPQSASGAVSGIHYAVRDAPCMTRLTTMAAMPASTALACGDPSMSMIGFDRCACSLGSAASPLARMSRS